MAKTKSEDANAGRLTSFAMTALAQHCDADRRSRKMKPSPTPLPSASLIDCNRRPHL